MIDRSRLEFEPGLWLDARGAVWLERESILAVADLHIGYAWAHRQQGNLLPVSAPEATTQRLLALIENYAPRDLVLLGDIVHSTARLPALEDELCTLFERLAEKTAPRLITGNHDAQLLGLLGKCGIDACVQRELRAGPHLLLHGEGRDATVAEKQLADAAQRRGRVIIGHEHPAIRLSDGVATSAKCPCFVFSAQLLVLPAFSPWSAGTNVRSHEFMSSLGRHSRMEGAVAIAAGKLLPIRL